VGETDKHIHPPADYLFSSEIGASHREYIFQIPGSLPQQYNENCNYEENT
jgi:hypothetical protein